MSAATDASAGASAPRCVRPAQEISVRGVAFGALRAREVVELGGALFVVGAEVVRPGLERTPLLRERAPSRAGRVEGHGDERVPLGLECTFGPSERGVERVELPLRGLRGAFCRGGLGPGLGRECVGRSDGLDQRGEHAQVGMGGDAGVERDDLLPERFEQGVALLEGGERSLRGLLRGVVFLDRGGCRLARRFELGRAQFGRQLRDGLIADRTRLAHLQ